MGENSHAPGKKHDLAIAAFVLWAVLAWLIELERPLVCAACDMGTLAAPRHARQRAAGFIPVATRGATWRAPLAGNAVAHVFSHCVGAQKCTLAGLSQEAPGTIICESGTDWPFTPHRRDKPGGSLARDPQDALLALEDRKTFI